MVKNVYLAMVALLFAGMTATAQTASVSVGSNLVLGTPDAQGYDHVNFPQKNFIMKRGAVADFNRLAGLPVVVREVSQRNGETFVTLERQDGKKFFRFYQSVTARLDKALESGELSRS